MTIFLTIIAVVVIFSLLVLIHEYGHFSAARKAGIRVLEFGFGFPPRLWKKKVGETLYTINAIPFGGFVKLYGEDSSDPKAFKDPASFSSQSKWVRAKVVLAGVVMNFLLAIGLLTVGFIFGIEPLLVSEHDLYSAIEQGVVKTAPGVFIDTTDPTVAVLGIAPGDEILAIDDTPITHTKQIAPLARKSAEKDVDLLIRKKSDARTVTVHVPLVESNSLGIQLKPVANIPRLIILNIKEDGLAKKVGFKKGDVILSVDGKEIYSWNDFQTALFQKEALAIRIVRGDVILDIPYVQNFEGRVIITDVFADSPAEKFGFRPGDRIISIGAERVTTAAEVQKVIANADGSEKNYELVRDANIIRISARIEPKSRLGIALSEAVFFNRDDFSFYTKGVITSLLEIGDIRLSPWPAFKQAISESARLTGVTVNAFGNTIKSLLVSNSVPSDIGGPVQIAYYTHTFVQQGFFALLRFTALLSLSLAVMNVLPIPALDGGRLFFIIVETVTGRKVAARFEAVIHAVGFILLMALIAVITYSDIVKLF